MRSLIRGWFGSTPKAGEVWELADGNPFKRQTVTVLDVRDGWTRFQYGDTPLTSELENYLFRYCYRRKL